MTTARDEALTWNALHPVRDLPKRVIRILTVSAVKSALLDASGSAKVAAISAGQNIGLGGRLGPWSADCLLDLSALRAIRSLDETFGVVQLEPGVTFQDLHDHLRARQSRWYFPGIGGPPEASVIGNVLQRGDGTGAGGNRRNALISLDVILPTGELIQTSLSTGPNLTDLFIQSDFGIVVGATIALTPLPKVMQGFSLQFSGSDELGHFIEGLGVAMRAGSLAPGAVSIWNGVKHGLRTGAAGDPDEWYASGAIHGASEARTAVDWRDCIDALRAAKLEARILNQFIDRNPSGRGPFQGEPSAMNVASTRSGLSTNGMADPSAAGFAWVCPVLPLSAEDVGEAIAITRETLGAYSISPNISLSCHDHRTVRAFIALAWDRSARDRDCEAIECHDRLLERLAEAGYPPFRLGHLSRDWRPISETDEAAVLARIAIALAHRTV